jgi:hypothetical protein
MHASSGFAVSAQRGHCAESICGCGMPDSSACSSGGSSLLHIQRQYSNSPEHHLQYWCLNVSQYSVPCFRKPNSKTHTLER